MSQKKGFDCGSLFARPSYFEELGNTPVLDEQEERVLISRVAEGDPDAREQLIMANLRLVVFVARPFARFVSDAEFSDLIQEANIGLIEAVDRVDAARENRFSTYAAWWIKHYIYPFLEAHGKLIHIPRKVTRRARMVLKVEYALMQKHGRVPSLEEVAHEMRVPVDDLFELERVSRVGMSLDSTPLYYSEDATFTLGDTLADDATLSIEEDLVLQASCGVVRGAIASLKPRDARIIKLRFGLNGDEPLTLDEIGKQEGGVTRERIRAIEHRILKTLRSKIDQTLA